MGLSKILDEIARTDNGYIEQSSIKYCKRYKWLKLLNNLIFWEIRTIPILQSV